MATRRRVTFFENDRWQGPNGLSVLAARPFITERTLLVMADQIAAPALVRELASLPPSGDRSVLAIDRDLSRVFDIDDATKVKLAGDRVTRDRQGPDGVRRGQRRDVRDVAVAGRRAGVAARAVADRRRGGGGRAAGWWWRTTSAPSCGRTSTAPR